MAKVSDEARKIYFERISVYKKKIETMEKNDANLEKMIENDPVGAPFKKLMLADDALNQISYFLLMNNLSLVMLSVKNENFLNSARKKYFQALIYMEEVVGTQLDVPYSEYEEKLEKIDALDVAKRYIIVRKLGFTIGSLKAAYGDNSKWKWSFVEMEARMATIAKNMLNLKTVIKCLDPDYEFYEEMHKLLDIVTREMENAANRYRQKYEISTHRQDDFRVAISFLTGLKRILILLGKTDQVEQIKRKADIWMQKLESDMKTMKEKAKRNR